MTERQAAVLKLLTALISPEQRSAAAQELATLLGAEALIVFVKDSDVDALLPAPGFPQTLPNGREWQTFLRGGSSATIHRGIVSWPDTESRQPALGVFAGCGAALVLIGGAPREDEASDLAHYLPLLCAALQGERAVAHCAAEARFAAQLAQQARELAVNLDQARRAAQDEIAARKRAEAEVRELNERLEQRVRERTESLRQAVAQMEEFSYSVSHDLRSPLRAIQGYAQILARDVGDRLGPEGLSYVERILAAGGRLDRLTQDVLTYTRVTREGIEMGDVDLDTLVPALVEEYGMANQEARIEVNQPLGRVRGHEALLAQCLSNLIGNGLKFVQHGVPPRLRIWTESKDTQRRIFVADNGIGIRAEDQSRIFQLFERLDTKHPGTGLGLAIVRKAAERMQGSVGVTSEPGRGSTFWIEVQSA
jgi:signal transduction histidine kinase